MSASGGTVLHYRLLPVSVIIRFRFQCLLLSLLLYVSVVRSLFRETEHFVSLQPEDGARGQEDHEDDDDDGGDGATPYPLSLDRGSLSN